MRARCVRIYLWWVLLNNGQWIHPTPHYCTCWYPDACACLVYHFSSTAIEYIWFILSLTNLFLKSTSTGQRAKLLAEGNDSNLDFGRDSTHAHFVRYLYIYSSLSLSLSRRVLYSICAIVLFSWIDCCTEMWYLRLVSLFTIQVFPEFWPVI